MLSTRLCFCRLGEPQLGFAASSVAAPSSWHAEASSQGMVWGSEKVLQQQARTQDLLSLLWSRGHMATQNQHVAEHTSNSWECPFKGF